MVPSCEKSGGGANLAAWEPLVDDGDEDGTSRVTDGGGGVAGAGRRAGSTSERHQWREAAVSVGALAGEERPEEDDGNLRRAAVALHSHQQSLDCVKERGTRRYNEEAGQGVGEGDPERETGTGPDPGEGEARDNLNQSHGLAGRAEIIRSVDDLMAPVLLMDRRDRALEAVERQQTDLWLLIQQKWEVGGPART